MTGPVHVLKDYLKSRASADETLVMEEAGVGTAAAAAPPGRRAGAAAAAVGGASVGVAAGAAAAAAATVPALSVAGGSGVLSASAAAAAADRIRSQHASSAATLLIECGVRDGLSSGRVEINGARVGAHKLTSVSLEQLNCGVLAALPRIRCLILENHALETLPHSLLVACPALQELSLANCGLKAVPECLTAAMFESSSRALPSRGAPLASPLATLNLAGNDFSRAVIPPLVSSITHLDMSHCRLPRIPPAVRHLQALHTLLLHHNTIRIADAGREADEDDYSLHIAALRVLDLSSNALHRLPACVLALVGLHTLLLNDNELAVIPPHLGMLTSLEVLNVEGNPQRAVRVALAGKGAGPVLAHLRSRIPAGTEYEYIELFNGSSDAGTASAVADAPVARAAGGAFSAAPVLDAPTMSTAPAARPYGPAVSGGVTASGRGTSAPAPASVAYGPYGGTVPAAYGAAATGMYGAPGPAVRATAAMAPPVAMHVAPAAYASNAYASPPVVAAATPYAPAYAAYAGGSVAAPAPYVASRILPSAPAPVGRGGRDALEYGYGAGVAVRPSMPAPAAAPAAAHAAAASVSSARAPVSDHSGGGGESAAIRREMAAVQAELDAGPGSAALTAKLKRQLVVLNARLAKATS